jgi:hypothetical protein
MVKAAHEKKRKKKMGIMQTAELRNHVAIASLLLPFYHYHVTFYIRTIRVCVGIYEVRYVCLLEAFEL